MAKLFVEKNVRKKVQNELELSAQCRAVGSQRAAIIVAIPAIIGCSYGALNRSIRGVYGYEFQSPIFFLKKLCCCEKKEELREKEKNIFYNFELFERKRDRALSRLPRLLQGCFCNSRFNHFILSVRHRKKLTTLSVGGKSCLRRLRNVVI